MFSLVLGYLEIKVFLPGALSIWKAKARGLPGFETSVNYTVSS